MKPAFALVFALIIVIGVAAAQQPSDQLAAGISPEALAQIEALIAEKDARTATQQKIDSQLIYELKMEQGVPVASGVDTVETDLPYAPDGHVIVDVTAREGSDLANRLPTQGVEVISASGPSLRVHINIDQVEALAADPDVVFVQPRQNAMTTQMPNLAAPTGQGSRSSEGDVTHLAFAARGAFHIDGTGVKIGVLSDGVMNLAASQATGDLGSVTVLPGQAGSGDEGTAMLEIIHDLAPGAQLYFATAFGGITSFAQNIRDLRTAGCDIIVDDVFYFVETPFQDGQAPTVVSNTNGGVVIQAVKDVTASGALYFSSAGNSGNLDAGTAGAWEGDFVDGGPTSVLLPVGRLHKFGGQSFDVITVATGNPVNLYWSDPLGGSSNDYDLFRLNKTGTEVLAGSTNIQNGTQDPYEQVSSGGTNPAAADQRIVIVKKAAAAGRFLHLNTNRGQLSIRTAGTTHGHAAVTGDGAYGVAATPAVGPYPQIFNPGNRVETFSSDGPRHIFYQADGTPITPGNVSTSGGQVLQKPDITAADGVSVTGVGGFPSTFFGTSAAAPHAGAIAALVKSANPALTPTQIRTILTSTAIDIQAPGVDRDSGAGIIMARAAVSATGAVGTAYLLVDSVQASDNPGNGDGFPEAGEGARLTVTLKNFGVAPATGILASLTSPTAGITVTQPNTTSYPDLAPIASAGNASPLLFTAASDLGCPASASFAFTASYAGGSGPLAETFQVPIGPGSFTVTNNLNGVAPTTFPVPGVTFAAGTQTGRLFRDGVASVCGVQKVINSGANPNPVDSVLRKFESYQFDTCSYSSPSCATVTLQGASAINLFTAAYAPTFNSGSLLQNYKADAGASAASRTYSFDLGAGAQSFAIDVHHVPVTNPPATPSGLQYTLTVAGACLGACDPPNHVPVARAKNVTVPANDICKGTASINDGSSDADGVTLTITQAPDNPYPLGVTPVLLTVTDPKGATSQATGNVTVNDTKAPSIACPASISTNTAPGLCSAPATFSLPTATDNCAVSSVTTSAAPGSTFALGTTSVTGIATDTSGNTDKCSFDVTVVDREPPTISCPAPISANTAPGMCSAPVAFPLPAVTDNCAGPTLSTSVAPGSTFALGTTTVIGTATDGSGNQASCTLPVTVIDREPPSITCPAPITVNTAPGMCSAPVAFPLPAVTDNCAGPTRSTSVAPGSTFALGTTTVIGTATDGSGNQATCTLPVTVVDNEPPQISGPAASPASLWPPNHKMIDVTVSYGLSDNCAAGSCVLTVSSNEPINDVGDGNTSPDWQVIDAHHVQLRAERAGPGNGRVYTIAATCTDAAGNKTVRTTMVIVPHDQRQ